MHLFCECKYVKPFWVKVRKWIEVKTKINIRLTNTEILLCSPKGIPLIIDLFYILGKKCIFMPVNSKTILQSLKISQQEKS